MDWDWEAGEQAFKRTLDLKPNFAEALACYSNLLCYMDRLDEALAMAEFSKQTYISPYFIAQTYVLAGDKDDAMEWLERAYDMRDPMMPYVSSPNFDLLDDDPRYQDLLRRMNLPVRK